MAFILVTATVKILREYERAVVFTLGRFQKVKGPGLVLLIPFIQEMVRVDLRIQVIEIPTQDVISHDNVSMKVDAVLYFNVVNPERAIIQVQNYLPATNMLAQTTLRAVLGQHELDEMLSERKKLSEDVQSILDAQTETWGIKVSNVEIRTVELTDNMVKAIAKQAEAERDRRAKIIHAEAEFQASQTLVNAAKILSSIPAAMQLRYLQTLTEIGAEQNSTIIFPMPIDIIKPFLELLDKAGKAPSPTVSFTAPLSRNHHWLTEHRKSQPLRGRTRLLLIQSFISGNMTDETFDPARLHTACFCLGVVVPLLAAPAPANDPSPGIKALSASDPAGTCRSDVHTFNGQMEKDGYWVGGSAYGYGYPMGNRLRSGRLRRWLRLCHGGRTRLPKREAGV